MRRHVLFLLLTALLSAQSAKEVEITAEPHHHLAFTNAHVRVFNVNVPPRGETLLHRHRHDYIYIQFGASEVLNSVQGKAPITIKLQDGQTGFVSASFAHVARNLTDQPFRNVDVEFLQDEKLRHSQFRWDEDRSLDILQGGTKDILFVKDAVRASEVELQPGGILPSDAHTRSTLVVALTDCQFHGMANSKHSESITLKSGEGKWIPGRVTLTNHGDHPAKFVTLEFPPTP